MTIQNDAAYRNGPGELALSILKDRSYLPNAYLPKGLHWRFRLLADMRRTLPYGYYVEGDGCIVPFDRRYRPMWRVSPDGSRALVEPSTWINYIAQCWHFNDGNLPWHDGELLSRMRAVFKTNNVEVYCEIVAEIQAQTHAFDLGRNTRLVA